MTREEAIKLLVNATYSDEWQGNEDLTTAHNMAIKALEMVEKFEKAQIITGGRLNGRTYAYKCGLDDGKRKALDKVKQARRELDKLPIYGAKFTDEFRIHLDREEVFSILDKLIESEG